ncbi:MAG: ATP-dependent helicase, partial [Candidatus Omnitrophica bacterium]|nr:ATP-dependent helicase [Candidatus Omnitrophota bacterium]
GMSFEKSNSFYKTSLAIARLLKDSDTRPIHDILMQFIDDTDFYKFILKEYQDKRLLRIRDIRAMSSFINKVKNSSMSNPNLTVSEFLSELDLRERHNLPITGELVTYTQDGVKIITAHASKGLEFHTVIIPFCLQDKSWPLKAITDKIPLPVSVIKTKESVSSKSEKDLLNFFDETRLFYVAASRAKANLVFTSSPSENAITSSFFNNIKIAPRESKESEEDIINEFFMKIEERDPFEYSKGVLKNMIKDLTLTPTKLNTYLRCKRKFLYNCVLLLPGRKKQSLIFGNCVHKALEEVYRKYKKEKAFPDFDYFKDIFLRGLRYEAIDKAIKTRCEEKLPLLEKWFTMAKDKAVMPLDLEKNKIIVLNGGIRFAGKFDKIEFEDESKKLIRVIDYKTGIPDKHIKKIEKISSVKNEDCDDYLRQLVAYKMLYERDTYERSHYKVSHGMLVFVEPAKDTVKRYNLIKGKYVDKKVKITEGMVHDLEELIRNVWNSINNLKFDKPPEKDKNICPSCDFCSICWNE